MLRDSRKGDLEIELEQQSNQGMEIPEGGPSDISSLPPVDAGFRAWAFVCSAFVLQFLVWAWGASFGTFQAYLTANEPFASSSSAVIASIGTVGVCLQYCCLATTLWWYKRHPYWIQAVMKWMLVISTGSLILSSFGRRVWQLILSQGVLWGVSSSALHSPVFLYLGEWFSTRRGLATGILMAATGVGGAVIPPFLGFLLERVGFGWALRIWAGVYFILGALSLPYAKPRIPPPSRPILRESGMGQGGKNLKDRTWSWGTFKTATGRQVELWGNPLFLLVATTVTLHSMAIFPVSFYLPIYASTLGFPLLTSTLVLSAYNVASAGSYILIGYLADRFDFRTLLISCSLLASILSYTVWGFARNLALTLVFASGFGLSVGGAAALWPAAGTHIVRSVSERGGTGRFDSNSIFSLLSILKGIAVLAGPPLASLLYQPTTKEHTYGAHGFQNITIFVGSLMLGAGIFSTGSRLLRR